MKKSNFLHTSGLTTFGFAFTLSAFMSAGCNLPSSSNSLLSASPVGGTPSASPVGASDAAATATTVPQSAAATAASTVAITTGPRAAKIIFKQSYPNGSFDAAPVVGTVPGPGYGHPAVRIFNPDGSILANGSTSSAWPKWLSRFEIGISGSSNTAALNSNCAKFADTTESTSSSNCNFSSNGTSSAVGCGAANGLFRISEMDCLQNPPTDGTGSPTDGIYLRATLNRSQMGSGENLMAVFEYIASSYEAGPASPTTCFPGGTYSPEACSNVTWKVFLKHNTTEMVQPFLMLVPPTQNYVNTGLVSSGVNPSARQFFMPLAADPTLSVVQISRIHSNLNVNDTNVQIACAGAAGALTGAANSPLCAGLVLYSLTFYRM